MCLVGMVTSLSLLLAACGRGASSEGQPTAREASVVGIPDVVAIVSRDERSADVESALRQLLRVDGVACAQIESPQAALKEFRQSLAPGFAVTRGDVGWVVKVALGPGIPYSERSVPAASVVAALENHVTIERVGIGVRQFPSSKWTAPTCE